MRRGLDAYCHLRSVLKRAAHVLPRRLDGKWACGEQIDKFRGPFPAFVSSWTGLAHADKLKRRQCTSLFPIYLLYKPHNILYCFN